MKEFVNKHLTAIIAAVFALIVVIVLAVVFIGGNDKDKNPGKEPGTEISTEIGTETGSVEDNIEDVETPSTEIPSTEVTTPETPSTEDANVSETPAPQPSETPQPEQPQASTYTYKELDKTMYAKSSVNVRNLPSTDGEKVGSLKKGQPVTVTGQCNETKWYCINLDGKVAFVSNNYLVDNKPKEETPSTPSKPSTPEDDTPSAPAGKEYITVNGFTLDVTDMSAKAIENRKKIAETGYYNPIWDSEYNGYYMLIKKTDNDTEWRAWLRNYIEERGGISGVGFGSNFCDVKGEAYCIGVQVEQQE